MWPSSVLLVSSKQQQTLMNYFIFFFIGHVAVEDEMKIIEIYIFS